MTKPLLSAPIAAAPGPAVPGSHDAADPETGTTACIEATP
ncbi:hypothetical protein C7443_101492 [Plasticicumulans acidivorans]|uniref:Uncharacterized protein n=1 Tax=Plasticicumulans acidivorans TaxID=886464 RepID=A0A317N1J8_9GAMM|nr:hypothetical protein C7443_101492 [Plasticicumulans acidivorans]